MYVLVVCAVMNCVKKLDDEDRKQQEEADARLALSLQHIPECRHGAACYGQ